MPDYEKLYHDLFNAITDAPEAPERGAILQASALLIRAQQDAEEAYLAAGEGSTQGTTCMLRCLSSPSKREALARRLFPMRRQLSKFRS